MNDLQVRLYKALEVIANGVLTLEDGINITNAMTKKEVREVVDKFSDEITEFDKDSIYQDAYNFQGYADSIISNIIEKLK